MPGLKLSWSVQVFAYTKPGHKDWEMQLFVQMHKTQQEKKQNKTGSEREKGPIKGMKWIFKVNRKETNIYGLPDKFKIIILKKLKVLQENTLKTTKQN